MEGGHRDYPSDLPPTFHGAGGLQSHHCVGSRKERGGGRGAENGSFGTVGTVITELQLYNVIVSFN